MGREQRSFSQGVIICSRYTSLGVRVELCAARHREVVSRSPIWVSEQLFGLHDTGQLSQGHQPGCQSWSLCCTTQGSCLKVTRLGVRVALCAARSQGHPSGRQSSCLKVTRLDVRAAVSRSPVWTSEQLSQGHPSGRQSSCLKVRHATDREGFAGALHRCQQLEPLRM